MRRSMANQEKIALALAALMALSALGCKPSDSSAAPDKPAARAEVAPVPVETALVRAESFTQTLEFLANAEPVEQRLIGAEASGKVLAAPFEEGTTVKKGELMLRVDAKMNSAQINVLRSQESANARELERMEQLASQGLATPQQVDQARAGLDQLRASIKQSQVGVSMATVRSPFTGHVTRKLVEPGEFIGAGSPIAELIDYSTLVLRAKVPEATIMLIKQDQEVEVRFEAAGHQAKGVVKRRSVTALQPSQLYEVEIHVPNEELTLLPGMSARILLARDAVEDAVMVPRDAILEGVSRREAMVVTGRKDDVGKAEVRVVELGASAGSKVVVKDGLKPGDELIVLGHRGLAHGASVRVVRQHKE